MFEKLSEVEDRYEELNGKLCDPEILQNRDLFLKLSKERADIGDLVETYREFRAAEERIAESKEMMEDPEMRELAKEELDADRAKLAHLETRIKLLLLPKDPNDAKNVMLEIRAGTGGEEASLFAGELFRLYSRMAERNGWKLEVMSSNQSSSGGMKEVVALIAGDRVYSRLKYESGVHRVQRVPATETQGRVHTSAASVAVLPEMDDVEIEIDLNDVRRDEFCSSGPGGQSVNTTYSAIRLTHIPSGIVVQCQDQKSKLKNYDKALKELKSRLYAIELQKQQAEIGAERKSMIGSGDRSDKIRTYNYPQGRVTDHRIGYSQHNLPHVMDGNVLEFIERLRIAENAEKLKAGQTD